MKIKLSLLLLAMGITFGSYAQDHRGPHHPVPHHRSYHHRAHHAPPRPPHHPHPGDHPRP